MKFFKFRRFSEHFLGYVELPLASKPAWIPTEYQYELVKELRHLPWYLYRRWYQFILKDSIAQGRNMNIFYGCVQDVGCSNASNCKRRLTGIICKTYCRLPATRNVVVYNQICWQIFWRCLKILCGNRKIIEVVGTNCACETRYNVYMVSSATPVQPYLPCHH